MNVSLDPPLVRPSWACLLCSPPTGTRPWNQADANHRTCSRCLNSLRDQLKDIAKRYGMLDATPGAIKDLGSRGAPGFGSKPTASPHIIAIRDRRSSPVAHVWVAGDGKIHRESEHPPLCVYNELDCLAWDICEVRGYEGGHDQLDVAALCRWLDHQLDWVTRQASVVEFEKTVRGIDRKLMPLTGDPRVYVAKCPNTLDLGEHTEVCGANLYYPTKGDTIACGNPACRRRWAADDWHSNRPGSLSRLIHDQHELAPIDVVA